MLGAGVIESRQVLMDFAFYPPPGHDEKLIGLGYDHIG